MIVGLGVSFIVLCIVAFPFISTKNLTFGNPEYAMTTIPIVILSFTSHIIVPSLKSYLNENVLHLRRVLLWGSILPLVFYLVWELCIMGLLPPSGPDSLAQIAKSPYPVGALTSALHAKAQVPWISIVVGFFSFFALLTSFFGVSLSLFDFLADGFRIKKDLKGRFLLLILMFTPPVLFALLYPTGFIVAIGYAGVFVAILYGILPAVMVWKGRYIEKLKEIYRVPGGRLTLITMIIGSILIIFFQIAATNHWLPTS